MNPSIDEVLSISKELKSKGIIHNNFFPSTKEEVFSILNESYIDFNSYIERILPILKADKYFDIYSDAHSTKEVLVIEVGGTKTSIQRIQIGDTITALTEVNEIPTISLSVKTDTNKLKLKDFVDWLENLIQVNIEGIKDVEINIPGAVSMSGEILLSPPNIHMENIKGVNLIHILNEKFPHTIFKMFNDTESVLAAQYYNPQKNDYSLFVDINGTGNNSSVYIENKLLQNLETGHVLCVKGENGKEELEYAVGGRLGIENNFNKIMQINNLTQKRFKGYDVLLKQNFDLSPIQSQISDVISHRMYMYKAISMICIESYCRNKSFCSNNPSMFILFGGINRIETTQIGIELYLDLFEKRISLSYTIFGEDAGRFGGALLSSF